MIQVASWLGNFSRGMGFAPQVSRGAINDMAQLKPYQVIAFGLPTNNPVIATLNEQLPQSFVPGENNLRQQIGSIDYRLPDKFSLGLLQILPAPWNSKRAVLVVTGTTQEGVEQTIKALTNDTYYGLEGNVAFLSKDRIELSRRDQIHPWLSARRGYGNRQRRRKPELGGSHADDVHILHRHRHAYRL